MVQQVSTRVATRADIPEVIALITAQEQRLHALDLRLRAVRSWDQITATVEGHFSSEEKPLVALNEQGRVRGYVQPALWKLSPESELLAFFTPTNGIADSLTLPSPVEEDAPQILSALLFALTRYWRAQGTTGDVFRWPNCDLWFEPLLKEHGFVLDSDLAYYPPQPLAPARHPASPILHTRLARPDDEEVLVELFEEELRYHQPYTPFVRISADVVSAFRARLSQLWAGETLRDGAPQVVVVERGNKVVAMAENDLYMINANEETYLLPAGCYGHLNNVSVRQETRGQGIGHMLVQAVFAMFAAVDVDGYLLWFNPDNPLASSFWSHLGFIPVSRTYQRPADANRSSK